MGMIATLIASLLGSVLIVALSRHLALSDDARDGIPPSLLTYGDEP